MWILSHGIVNSLNIPNQKDPNSETFWVPHDIPKKKKTPSLELERWISACCASLRARVLTQHTGNELGAPPMHETQAPRRAETQVLWRLLAFSLEEKMEPSVQGRL